MNSAHSRMQDDGIQPHLQPAGAQADAFPQIQYQHVEAAEAGAMAEQDQHVHTHQEAAGDGSANTPVRSRYKKASVVIFLSQP